MRIIRFMNTEGQIYYGCQYNGTTATIILGDIFTTMAMTTRRVVVREFSEIPRFGMETI